MTEREEGRTLAEHPPALTIRSLSNRYVTQSHGLFGKKEVKSVLKGIDLEIRRGEIVGLLGESGCGKSTLGRCILGLVDYEGEIRIDGRVQRRDGLGRRGSQEWRLEMARKVQGVFQDPSAALNPAKRVGWLLEEPLRVHRRGTAAERTAAVDGMLNLIGLDASYKTRRTLELSGGQKQRVSIGCALMLRPRLLIADEPVSSLDVSVGAQILGLFRDLHRQLSLSILFISHNLNVVYYLCDRIAVMREGRIIEEGPAERIYSAPQEAYTRTLLEASMISVPK
jgi:ABC-type glutathione transport system ATPase component